MKKTLLLLYLAVFSMGAARAQCVSTCGNYAVSPITFTTFTAPGPDVISSFLPNTDDGVTALIPIGFNFNFYCTTYTDIWICSNGFIQFNNGAPAISTGFADPTQSFPDPTAPNALVALNMNDLDPGSGGSITYATIGTTPNQRFVVTFSNVPVYGFPTSLHTGQIVLYETTNIIEIHTGSVINNGTTNGTQGIESPTGMTGGEMVPGRNNIIWSASNSAYQFAPFTPAPPTSVSGSTTVCMGTQNSYITVPMVGASSYNWTFPAGWAGTSTITAVTATAGASGNVSVTATYTCGTSAAATLAIVTVTAPQVAIMSATPAALCSGNTLTITPGGATSYTLNPGNYTGAGPFVFAPSASATYSLVGMDASNCVSYNPANVTIQVDPSPSVTVSSGSICSGASFSINPSGADSYNISGGFPVVSPSNPGNYTYTVTGTALNGCVSLSPVISSLTVNANPTVNIVASRAAICKGESTTLTASVASTYLWDGGATTNSLVVSPAATTGYTVTGTTAEGCSRSKNITITVYACTGLEEAVAGSAGVAVYPNPSTGLLHLRFDTPGKNALVEVFDATGRLLLSNPVSSAELQLDLAGYASGLYYLKVQNNGAFETLKIFKE